MFQSLHLELSDILGNNEILFPFMQFMKSEASVNVLQFYLSVGMLWSYLLAALCYYKMKTMSINILNYCVEIQNPYILRQYHK